MERQNEPDGAGATPPEGDDELTAHESTTQAVTITLPPQPRFIRVARLVAAGLASELGFGVDRLDDVRLAVGEACSLAVQVGARDVSLTYVLDSGLSVAIEAELGDADDHLDADYIALVEQVLAVACSSHDIDRDERRMSIRVTFTNGS